MRRGSMRTWVGKRSEQSFWHFDKLVETIAEMHWDESGASNTLIFFIGLLATQHFCPGKTVDYNAKNETEDTRPKRAIYARNNKQLELLLTDDNCGLLLIRSHEKSQLCLKAFSELVLQSHMSLTIFLPDKFVIPKSKSKMLNIWTGGIVLELW